MPKHNTCIFYEKSEGQATYQYSEASEEEKEVNRCIVWVNKQLHENLDDGDEFALQGLINTYKATREEFYQAVMTGFTPEVTPRKSKVEGGWDLASPYVVHPGLHAQWSCISGLVGGGDKNLSQGVNKPVRVGLSRLSE